MKTTKNTTAKRVLTTEQKQAMQLKRQLNPQFATLVSNEIKAERLNLQSNAVLMLLNVKKHAANISDDKLNVFENAELQSNCKKFINFLTTLNKDKTYKNETTLNLFVQGMPKNKKGLFTDYRTSQYLQGIVKLSMKKALSFDDAINQYNAIK